MLIYSEKEQLAVSLNNPFYISIEYNAEQKFYEILVYPEHLGYFSVYFSASRKKCKDMFVSILNAYEQGVKVFYI